MERIMHKEHSIYQKLALLLVLAIGCSVLFFHLSNILGVRVLDQYFLNSNYQERRDSALIKRFQKYVNKHQIKANDQSALHKWVKKENGISLQIFMNDALQYDSEYPDNSEYWRVTKEDYYGWQNYFTVSFADGTADVFLTGNYTYQWYTDALIIELILSFLLFFIIVLSGIHKEIQYIRCLCMEIGILEGGNLDYEITLQGNDELTELAHSLNDMRLSLKNQIDEEVCLTQSHKQLVTEMSHDLRTPLTSILIYTEILKQKKFKDLTQAKIYIEKIDAKAKQMKRLSDNLFEYSLISSTAHTAPDTTGSIESIFSDILSEVLRYLEENGFTTKWDLNWSDSSIHVNLDYINRIMDNLTSNILKYADRSQPVTIGTIEEDSYTGLYFENAVCSPDEKTESNHIGIRNIKNMMKGMGGRCIIREEEEKFWVGVMFRR